MLEPTSESARCPGRWTPLLCLLAAATLLAAACGGGEPEASTDDDGPALGQEGGEAPLDQGAEIAPETGPAAWRSEPGFLGRGWSDQPSGAGIVLLGDSVAATEAGPWSADGLVRNEGPGDVAGAEVTAVLHDAAGDELERPTVTVPVTPLRAGEPAPFRISATVPAEDVAEVTWLAESLDEPAASRAFDLEIFWDRPFGDPRPVDSYAYSDPPGEEQHAHVVLGSLANGGGAVGEVRAVGAWVDPSTGRVLWVAEGQALRPEGIDLDATGPLTGEDDFDDLGDVPVEGETPAEPPDAEGTSTVPDETPTDAAEEEPEGTTTTLAPAAQRVMVEWHALALGAGELADLLFVVKPDKAPPTIDDAELYIWAMGR